MSNGDRSYGPYGEKILAQKFKDTNKDFLGPYYEYEFNGIEADVILYIVPSADSLYIQSMARARRLLIIVNDRHDGFYDAVLNSEGTGTKIVGYGSGWFLSSRVRFGSGRSFKILGRL